MAGLPTETLLPRMPRHPPAPGTNPARTAHPPPCVATIRLANDFTNVNVAPPEPVTVEELKQEEARLQREAAAARQRGIPQPAGSAQWGRTQGRQREQHGRPREQYGRQGQQGGKEQYGQRRQPRQDGRPPYDRARSGGGGGGQQRRGGNRPQQWQPRRGGGAGDVRQWPDN